MPLQTDQLLSFVTNFFIFDHDKSFPENEEHKSIIYYFPETTPVDIQMKETGRAAAILKFTRTFDVSNPCRSLHTSKSRQYFYQPEPAYCMVLTLKLSHESSKGEVYPGELNDLVLSSLLRQSYKMFRFFMGTFSSACKNIDDETERKSIMTRTSYFFPKYLASIPFESAEISDALFGIQFLPLDKLLFLKVQSMVHTMEQSFPSIQASLILHQDQIIWGGLSQEDTQLVNHYLTTGLLPASVENNQECRFLTGPTSGKALSDVKTPRVFLNHCNAEPDECHLVVYRISNVTVCLFVEVGATLDRDFFVSIDSALAPRVAMLGTELAEQILFHKNQASTISPGDLRFIYFNQSNLAFKSTLHHTSPVHGRVLQCNSANIDALKVCADLSEDLKMWGDGEIVVKTTGDTWVVSKLNNRRELYVVVTRKNANLNEICDEVSRICSSTLSNILMLD